MIPEIVWLAEFLVNEKLPKSAKDSVVSRLKEIAGQAQVTPAIRATPPHMQGQAPSTLANLAAEPPVNPMMPPPLTSARIQGGEVDTGKGTRGPKKW